MANANEQGGSDRRLPFLAEFHRGVLDKRYSLEKPEIVIGRGTDADVRVDENSVSRHHAAVRRRGEKFVIVDLGSSNGTFVNNVRVPANKERELKENDCIFVGKVIFCFLHAEPRAAAKPDTLVDPATGVHNLPAFAGMLDRAITRARKAQRPLALFLVGIDDMSSINERYGEAIGDMAIGHVAGVIKAGLEPGEDMFRYRGAVFAVISPDLLDGLVLARAERLRAANEAQPFAHGEDLVLITVSVGATPVMTLGSEQVMEAADAALSRAKQRGNCVERPNWDTKVQTGEYRRRMVPDALFAEWFRPPAVAFAVWWTGAEHQTLHPGRQTPLDFELQTAVQRNLSGEELATFPAKGRAVIVTLPPASYERVPRLVEAIRASFDQALEARGHTPVDLRFGQAYTVEQAAQVLALAAAA